MVIVYVLVTYTGLGEIQYYCGYSIGDYMIVTGNFEKAACYLTEEMAIEVNNHLANRFNVEEHGYHFRQ